MGDMDNPGETRVSVSLAQLRAELSGMELRIVDRLNEALSRKADRLVQDQLVARMAETASRTAIIEATMIRKDGPVVHQIEDHGKQLTNLQAVASYKKWLWAQTVALVGIVMALMALLFNGSVPGGGA